MQIYAGGSPGAWRHTRSLEDDRVTPIIGRGLTITLDTEKIIKPPDPPSYFCYYMTLELENYVNCNTAVTQL